MNKTKLREMTGSLVKIRPLVRRILVRGNRLASLELPALDYDWLVEEPFDPQFVIRLQCLPTGHFVQLGTDGVYEFRLPNFLVLKFQLALTNDGRVLMEPLPDPRTRYRRQSGGVHWPIR